MNEAKAQVDDLVRRAEAGEDIVVTNRGRPVARLTAVRPPVEMPELPPDLAARRERLLELSSMMALEKAHGPDAAHAADFLYDEFGLPG